MSLYNLAFGFNPAVFLALPMLGLSAFKIERFRDCFFGFDKDLKSNSTIRILVRPMIEPSSLTKATDPNKKLSIEDLEKHPNFINLELYDDDPTYIFCIFSVPSRF